MFDSPVLMKGKHATWMKLLSRKPNEKKNFKDRPYYFDRYIDVYMMSSIIGFIYNRKSEVDKSNTDTANIFADAFIKEQRNCEFLYRLMMLIEEEGNEAEEVRVNRAFRDDSDEDALKENMEVFNAYVRGGIEVLFEKLGKTTTKDDYVDTLFEMTKLFYHDMYTQEHEALINETIKGN